ncbi:MAG: hypothetical protein WC516_00520 [Patescibacteria group bacterium]
MKLGTTTISLVALLAALLVLPACTINLGTNANVSRAPEGGIWKSVDSGHLWSQSNILALSGGKAGTISGVEVQKIVFDPQDSKAIYLATGNDGIIYTYDNGVTWRKFNQLSAGRIRSIAVDPKNKCILYALMDNKVYKSQDCGRFWQVAYYHQDPAVVLTDITINKNNPATIFVSNSKGEIIKSTDAGNAWAINYRLPVNTTVVEIVPDLIDSRIMYVGTKSQGIYKTADGGDSWASLGDGLKSYSGSHEYKKLIMDPATPNSLIFISKFGMLISRNGGNSWDMVNLLPSPKAVTIYTVAVNPKDSNEIYYTTQTTLVKSLDGGKTWSSQKLPFSNRWPNAMAVNPASSSVLYLGTVGPTK